MFVAARQIRYRKSLSQNMFIPEKQDGIMASMKAHTLPQLRKKIRRIPVKSGGGVLNKDETGIPYQDFAKIHFKWLTNDFQAQFGCSALQIKLTETFQM